MPSGNEEKIVDVLVRLGYKEVMFLYKLGDFKKKSLIKYNINVKFGVLVDGKDVFKAKKLSKYVFVSCVEDNRKVVDNFRPYAVFDYENHSNEDFIHHRNSGLNHIMCKIMKKNKVKYCLCFKSLLNKDRVKIIGRMKQNIKLFKKYKVDFELYSFASNEFELRSRKDLDAVKKVLS